MSEERLVAEVVFDRPMDVAYSYLVPDALRERIAVGQRVECSLGFGSKTTFGYCVKVGMVVPERTLKPILAVPDDVPLLDDHLLKLTRWMADYYLCSWGQVLSAVVPAGVRDQAGIKTITLVEAVPSDELPSLVPTVTPRQRLVLEKLREAGMPMEQKDLAKALEVSAGVIESLINKGLVKKSKARVERDSPTFDNIPAHFLDDDVPNPTGALTLNTDQESAWETIETAIKTGGFQTFLLHGVTGSGKTEIYLRAIEEVVKQGKEAIVLVPEISLTPQTIERFRGRCGRVAVLHSHLSDPDRAAYWRDVASGQVTVVVGARSAVFAPTRKLGLIVVDEEHETSFKQESTPRYHARDVAVVRSQLAGVPILLGSATPSLESWNAVSLGKYRKISLPKRVENRPMPKVRLVDLRHEPKLPGKRNAVGPTLEQGIKSALAAGGQVILLLNRRGFSTHIHCPSCGHVAQCTHCDLALTFHRAKAALVCHHCGWETPPIMQCPVCQQPSIRYMGLGTEKLQSELEDQFPGRVIQRMDSDTMSRSGSHERALTSFREGRIHILIGTQMIAKGLDFPNVTLVGVVNADVSLHLPDFRAAERTFQLLAQVAGRAGRGDKGGQVMIQTYTPEHPSIALAANHNYEDFARQELAFRKEHQYPPYHRMARLIIRSTDQEAAGKFADDLAAKFQVAMGKLAASAKEHGVSGPLVRLLGPAECAVFKLHDYYRFHFQLQSHHSGTLHAVIREVLGQTKTPHGVEFQVDIDPYNML